VRITGLPLWTVWGGKGSYLPVNLPQISEGGTCNLYISRQPCCRAQFEYPANGLKVVLKSPGGHLRRLHCRVVVRGHCQPGTAAGRPQPPRGPLLASLVGEVETASALSSGVAGIPAKQVVVGQPCHTRGIDANLPLHGQITSWEDTPTCSVVSDTLADECTSA
jgi:hypothetical protein